MLVIIEAPGKVSSVLSTLIHMGTNNPYVIPTFGHISKLPDSLYPSFINKDLMPTRLDVCRHSVVDAILEHATLHDEIVVATDPDAEGELIAFDVLNIIRKANPSVVVSRAMLYGMDEAHISHAIENRGFPNPLAAMPAIRRRSIDRLISASLSKPSEGIYVGRVMSVASACYEDIGEPPETIEKRVLNGSDIIYYGSRSLGTTPTNMSKRIQKSYEKGRMSYPRSDSIRVSEYASRCIEKYCDTRIDAMDNADNGAHPAPYPMVRIESGASYNFMSEDDAAIAFISRQWQRVGLHHGFIPRERLANETPEQRLVRTMIRVGVGRPGTMHGIAHKIINTHKIINDSGVVTDKGRHSIRAGRSLYEHGVMKALSIWIEHGDASVLKNGALWRSMLNSTVDAPSSVRLNSPGVGISIAFD